MRAAIGFLVRACLLEYLQERRDYVVPLGLTGIITGLALGATYDDHYGGVLPLGTVLGAMAGGLLGGLVGAAVVSETWAPAQEIPSAQGPPR